jgi:hypothetical protein
VRHRAAPGPAPDGQRGGRRTTQRKPR